MSHDLPDVPGEVLQAHEDGDLVFFCGAGISRAAGLDDFPGLVDRIHERFGTADPKEEEVLRSKPPAYDRFLHLVESRLGSTVIPDYSSTSRCSVNKTPASYVQSVDRGQTDDKPGVIR